MKSLAIVLSFFVSLNIVSCNQESNDHLIGRYVYLDDSMVLHIDENCANLKSWKNKKGQITYAKFPIDTAELMSIKRVCSKCVNDVAYDGLRNLCLRNEKFDDYRKYIYDGLISANYDMEEYKIFVHNIADAHKRKRLYNAIIEEGWVVGTFEEFSIKLGYKP